MESADDRKQTRVCCRFEKLAEECMSNIEVLKKAHAKGRSVPKYHTEERTFNSVKYEHTHVCQ